MRNQNFQVRSLNFLNFEYFETTLLPVEDLQLAEVVPAYALGLDQFPLLLALLNLPSCHIQVAGVKGEGKDTESNTMTREGLREDRLPDSVYCDKNI